MKIGDLVENKDLIFSYSKPQGGWVSEDVAKGFLATSTGNCVWVDDCTPYGSNCHQDQSKCVTGSFCLTINNEMCDDCCQPGQTLYEYNQLGSAANWIQGGKCDGSFGPTTGFIDSVNAQDSVNTQASGGNRCSFYVCDQSGTFNRCTKYARNWGNYILYQTYGYDTYEDCCAACNCETKGACCRCSENDPPCVQTTREECKTTGPGRAVWLGRGTICSSCQACPNSSSSSDEKSSSSSSSDPLGRCIYTYFYGAFFAETVCTVSTRKDCEYYANQGSFFGNDDYIWTKCDDPSQCNSKTECGYGTMNCQETTYLPGSYDNNPCGSVFPNGWANSTTHYTCDRLPISGGWMVRKTQLYTCPAGSTMHQFGSSGGAESCKCRDKDGNWTDPIPPPKSLISGLEEKCDNFKTVFDLASSSTN
jgi:hypothetical protein